MPEQELNRPIYKNVSVQELNRLLDEVPDLEEKLALAQFYLLCYGINGTPSCTPAQLVNAAKEKILQGTVDAKMAFYKQHGYAPEPTSFRGVDPGKIEDTQGTLFLKNPMLYMANMAKIIAIIDDDPDVPNSVFDLKANANTMADRLFNKKAMEEYASLQPKNRVEGFMAGLAKKQPGRDNASLEEMLERHKGGFWERWRNKTSQEFVQLRETLREFNDPESTVHGDLDALERDTKAYLTHKIPGYDPDQLPTQAQINSLSGTAKARAQFCLDILKTVREQRNLATSEEIYQNNPIESVLVELSPEELHLKYQRELDEAAREQKKFAEDLENEVEDEAEVKDDEVEEDMDADKAPIEEVPAIE